jgi:hypothetical protein
MMRFFAARMILSPFLIRTVMPVQIFTIVPVVACDGPGFMIRKRLPIVNFRVESSFLLALSAPSLNRSKRVVILVCFCCSLVCSSCSCLSCRMRSCISLLSLFISLSKINVVIPCLPP